MHLIPYTYAKATLPLGKTVYTIRILQEGDHAWQEADATAATEALEENGLVPVGPPVATTLETHPCLFARIDTKRTDLTSMYSEEELDPRDKETHRWCTYRIIRTTADSTVWLPPPPDASVPPFSLAAVLKHILKACGVEDVNGGWSS
jgi:hypothetical protein